MRDSRRRRPIEVGLHLGLGSPPQAGIVLGSWPDALVVARRADELGFDAITIGDHLLNRFDDKVPAFGAPECLSLLSALAASTSRVQIGPLVAATAYRNPAMLAKIATAIDDISGGRFFLGLGAGWLEYEFHAFGFPFDHRVDRFEEALQIILPLLRGGRVTFEGRHYSVRDCQLVPAPRLGGPPILIGAKGPRTIALAAQHADIWDSDIAPNSADPTSLRPATTMLDDACRDVGRDPASISRTTWIVVDLPDHIDPTANGPARMRASWGPASGAPEELAELFRGFAAEGLSRVQVWLNPSTPAGVEEFAKTLEILDRG